MRGLIDAIRPFSVESGLSRAYRRALSRHGATPQGVFWNSSKSQTSRFAALLGMVSDHAGRRDLSIADIGCGYGPMLDYMQDRPQYRSWQYAGIDITRAPESSARTRRRASAAPPPISPGRKSTSEPMSVAATATSTSRIMTVAASHSRRPITMLSSCRRAAARSRPPMTRLWIIMMTTSQLSRRMRGESRAGCFPAGR